MAKLYNLARMSTATVGTGTITLGSAVTSFLSFSGAGVSDGETITYAIEDGSNREIGRGVYTASGTTLTRSVLKSTSSNNPITLSGEAEVFITAAAEDFLSHDSTIFVNMATGGADFAGTSITGSNVIRTQGGNESNAIISMAAFSTANNRAIIRGRRARGTIASPTAVQADDFLLSLQGSGWPADDTDVNAKVSINLLASETWVSNTSNGTQIDFRTTPNGTASQVERARIDPAGNVIVGTAAVATTATDGFLYVPTCAGTPTGVPTTYTGRAPIVIDSTNNKLYFYSSGAWRDAGP